MSDPWVTLWQVSQLILSVLESLTLLSLNLHTLSPSFTIISRIEWQFLKALWIPSLTCALGNQVFTHSFLIIPNCPTPPLGRDSMTKLGTHVRLTSKSPNLLSLLASFIPDTSSSLPPTVVQQVPPKVWDTESPGTYILLTLSLHS
jgi:hypothetical protein